MSEEMAAVLERLGKVENRVTANETNYVHIDKTLAEIKVAIEHLRSDVNVNNLSVETNVKKLIEDAIKGINERISKVQEDTNSNQKKMTIIFCFFSAIVTVIIVASAILKFMESVKGAI